MTTDLRTVLAPVYPGRRIRSIDWWPYLYATSFHLDEVVVEFEDGQRDVLIRKDFDRSRMLVEARDHRPVAEHDLTREIQTYRRVLAPAGIGPPCRASVIDPLAGRFWLFLEKVPGVELWQIGDIEVWEDVVRWLSELHATHRPPTNEIAGAADLPVLDANWFTRTVTRACTSLESSADPRAATLRRGLVGLDLAVALGALPRTLVHGELYASNVLVGWPCERLTVWPVDWETAALGTALIDLAAISSGWDAATQQRLVDAYGALPGSQRDLLLCRLHLALRCIAWPNAWEPPVEHRQDWIGSAVELVEQVR
jgi:aminoglycoside phosphotransferase (APT) family kinase protein